MGSALTDRFHNLSDEQLGHIFELLLTADQRVIYQEHFVDLLANLEEDDEDEDTLSSPTHDAHPNLEDVNLKLMLVNEIHSIILHHPFDRIMGSSYTDTMTLSESEFMEI